MSDGGRAGVGLTSPDSSGVRFKRIFRICVPAILWTIVGLAAPAVIALLYHRDRATQEDFAVYYFEAQEMRHNINPYSTDFGLMPKSYGLNIHAIRRGNDPPTFVAFLFVPLTHFWWEFVDYRKMYAASSRCLPPICQRIGLLSINQLQSKFQYSRCPVKSGGG